MSAKIISLAAVLVASVAALPQATASIAAVASASTSIATGPSTSVPLSTVLSSAQVSLQTGAASHGSKIPYWSRCPLPVTSTTTSSKRYAPTITWPFLENGNFIDWKTYKSNGANLGGWLEKEKTHDPIWWDQHAPDANDEWTFCQMLGPKCGPVLEARYTSFLNTSTIDQLASVGVNTLRIPTTYAAWVKVPGSQLYTGTQQLHLRTITHYAITKYSMHIIIGLHSLPGGVNSLDIGEGLGHDAWFYNSTNLEYSFLAIDAVLFFIATSGHTSSFTLAPINEASDNLAGFGSAAGLSTNATNWILTYIQGVFKRIALVDKRIPLMLQDCFQGASYWAPFYAAGTNIVFDSHVYYFAAAGTYSEYVLPAVCGQAAYIQESETKFPTFIGEWSLQAMFNNTLADRKSIFDTERYAWEKYNSGGAFWTAISYSTAAVDGEGTQRDYWSYIDLINAGVITKATNASYCS
ncbi:hypothetical protein LTR62_006261 [Meristemomyces frigidus]|uniref:glucan 1,3-beta-glucosidase n=1 Tax=Meristemomyces frigidus TaxID=1508187 RepID=A0AAN7TEJ6_9PEZI|nr:hypothetical protein LTR62_006261 [Meristemomyces frigidus]